MAGPFDIQRVPKGLVDTLGMRGTGDNPHVLGQEVRSTIETTDFYLIERLSTFQLSTQAVLAAAATFYPVDTASIVPPGQFWLMYSLSFRTGSVIPAATGVKFFGCIQQTSIPCIVTDQAVGAVGESPGTGAHWERPRILRPGDRPTVFCSGITGAPGLAVLVEAQFAVILV